jgi:hypothetical protein
MAKGEPTLEKLNLHALVVNDWLKNLQKQTNALDNQLKQLRKELHNERMEKNAGYTGYN